MTMARNLDIADLRLFSLSVMRDCHEDLSDPVYVEPAAKILTAVMGSSPTAFAQVAVPTLAHCKENIRHPKSREHVVHLLGLVSSILEVRIAHVSRITEASLNAEAVKATDTAFIALFDDIYKQILPQAAEEELETKREPFAKLRGAINGMALLIRQPAIGSYGPGFRNLLPEDILGRIWAMLTELCQRPSTFLSDSFLLWETTEDIESFSSDVITAVQQAAAAYPEGCKSFISEIVQDTRHLALRESQFPGTLGESPVARELRKAAFISCADLPFGDRGLQLFVHILRTLQDELQAYIDSRSSLMTWRYFIDAMFHAYLHIKGAIASGPAEQGLPAVRRGTWANYVATKYPQLLHESNEPSEPNGCLSQDASLIALFVTRHLYRRATIAVQGAEPALSIRLNPDHVGSVVANWSAEYLLAVASMAGRALSDLKEPLQSSLFSPEDSLAMFRAGDLYQDIGNSPQRQWIGVCFQDIISSEVSSVGSLPLAVRPFLPCGDDQLLYFTLEFLSNLYPSTLRPIVSSQSDHS
jgi:DNA repair/transcription protein MET18/MMS19